MKCIVQSFIKTVVSAALAVAVCAAWAPGAFAADNSQSGRQNGNQQPQSQQHVNHQSYVSNGDKHYWVNGQHFVMNIGTGERRPVTDNNSYSNPSQDHSFDRQRSSHESYTSNGEKHYWVSGSEFTMNIGTGERHQVSK
jgi:hypothetical protein